MDSLPDRHSIRLKTFDYSTPGAYFITICVHFRKLLFGQIREAAVELNPLGEMVRRIWFEIPHKYTGIGVDECVVMPNHIHGILMLQSPGVPGVKAPSVPTVVGRYKSYTTKLYADAVRDQRWPPFSGRLWQRNYYERVIRSDHEFGRIKRYIRENPVRWDEDVDNPDLKSKKSFTDELDQLFSDES